MFFSFVWLGGAGKPAPLGLLERYLAAGLVGYDYRFNAVVEVVGARVLVLAGGFPTVGKFAVSGGFGCSLEAVGDFLG